MITIMMQSAFTYFLICKVFLSMARLWHARSVLQEYSSKMGGSGDGLALWTQFLGSLHVQSDIIYQCLEYSYGNVPSPAASKAHKTHANTALTPRDLGTSPEDRNTI